MAKKKSWGLIILGIVILVVIVCIGIVATVGFAIFRQMDIQTVASDSPDKDFENARARFVGQVPLIELPADGEADSVVMHREKIGKEAVPLTGLRVMVWDPRDHKLVRFTIPFWLLKLGRSGRIQLPGRDTSLSTDVSLHVTADEIERCGPGLILDYKSPSGEQILVWAE